MEGTGRILSVPEPLGYSKTAKGLLAPQLPMFMLPPTKIICIFNTSPLLRTVQPVGCIFEISHYNYSTHVLRKMPFSAPVV